MSQETNNLDSSKTIGKAAAIVSALIIAGAALLSPTEGYSVTLYREIPFIAQILTAVVVGTSLITTVLLLSEDRKRSALYTLSPVITLCAIFPFLPGLLGYVVKFSDDMNHVGNIQYIQETGSIPSIIYPAEHIISAMIVDISGIPGETILAILSPLAMLAFCAGIGLIARETGVPVAAPLLFVPATATLSSVVPSGFAWMVPFTLIIYLSIRITSSDTEHMTGFYISGLIMGIVLCIWHVFPAIVFLAAIGIMLATDVPRNTAVRRKATTILSMLSITGIAAYLWIVNSNILDRIGAILTSIFVPKNLPTTTLETSSITSLLFSQFGLSLQDVAILAIMKFGGLIIICTTAGLGIVLYFFRIGPKIVDEEYKIPVFIGIIIVGAGIWSILEATVGLVAPLNFRRVLRPVFYLGVISSGSLVWVLSVKARNLLSTQRRFATLPIVSGLVLFLVVSSSVVGAASISFTTAYNSPDTLQANRYIQPSDIEGMSWYFENKDQNLNVTTLWRYNWRYVNYILSAEEREARADELNDGAHERGYRAPAHFGYQNNSTFVKTIGCQYYIEGEYDRASYLKARPGEKFVRSDFQYMNTDPSVNAIYVNGNVNISKVGTC